MQQQKRVKSKSNSIWTKIIHDLLELSEIALQEKIQVPESLGGQIHHSGGLSALSEAELQLEICEFNLSECPFEIITQQCNTNYPQEDNPKIIVLKIHETMGLRDWMQRNIDCANMLFKHTHRCNYVILTNTFNNKTEIILWRIHYSNENTSSLDNSNLVKSRDIVEMLSLSRVFSSAYFLSFIYFDILICKKYLSKSQQLQLNDVISIEDSQLFNTLTQNNYNFEECTYLSEQKHCSSGVYIDFRSQHTLENIQNQFNLHSLPILCEVLLENEEYSSIQVYLGFTLAKNNKSQTMNVYFFKESKFIVLGDTPIESDHQGDIELNSQQQLDNYSFIADLIGDQLMKHNQSLTFLSNPTCKLLSVEKKIRKKHQKTTQFDAIVLINLNTTERTNEYHENEDTSEQLKLILSYLCQTDEFLQETTSAFEDAGSHYELNQLLSKDIPDIVSVISDISMLLGEPFQSQENQLVTSSLTKLFLINRL